MLGDAAVLELWTEGEALGAFARGARIASTVLGRDAAALTLGERNALLLRFHASLAGKALNGEVACPACAERVEFSIPVDAVLAAATAPEEPAFSFEGGERRFRLVRVGDVFGSDRAGSPADLMARCLAEPAEGLLDQPAFVGAFSDAMGRADPLADLRFALACGLCGHGWEEGLDPGRFAWQRLEHRAYEVLESVRVLAQHYGWTETEVLSLPPARRAYYARAVAA